MFNDQVGVTGFVDYGIEVARRFINSHRGVIDGWAVTMLLALVDVRLGECDLVPEAMQIFIDAAIVGCCAIPITRGQAGTKHMDLHFSALQLMTYVEKLFGAMMAGMARQNGFPTIRRKLLACPIIE